MFGVNAFAKTVAYGQFSEQDMSIQRAVVTGGEGDLGKAISASLGLAGIDVFAPGRGELDVTDVESVGGYFGEAGDIDLLVCNAGEIIDVPLSK